MDQKKILVFWPKDCHFCYFQYIFIMIVSIPPFYFRILHMQANTVIYGLKVYTAYRSKTQFLTNYLKKDFKDLYVV